MDNHVHSTGNEVCETCRRRDAVVLNDAGKAFCAHCWWALCEAAHEGRREEPRR